MSWRLRLAGPHCHIGSQIAGPARYAAAVERVVESTARLSAVEGIGLDRKEKQGRRGGLPA